MKQQSLPWLVRHDLRIEWRELSGGSLAGPNAWIIGSLLFGAVHFMWWLLMGSVLPLVRTQPEPILGGLLALVLLPVTVLLGVNQSIRTVFERNDLDLLLASPLPVRTVLASRLIGIAAFIFVTVGFFILPAVTIGLVRGAPLLLGLVPQLLALSLAGASLGMLITLLLVRLLGARRARVFSQIIGGVIGAILVLSLQIPLLTDSDPVELVQRFLPLFQPGGLLAAGSIFWWPGGSAFLDPLPTLAVLLVSGLLLAGAVTFLHNWFLLGVSSSSTPVSQRGRKGAGSLNFGRSGRLWRVMLTKEWKVLVRDPYLLSQTLLQVVYLIPLGIVIFMNNDGSQAIAYGPFMATGLVLIAGTLAGSLSRICLGGEEAMDLLLAAPVPGRTMRTVKIIAALVPVWVVTLPLALGLLPLDRTAAVVAIPLIAAVTLMTALIRLNNPHRTNRQDLFKRGHQGDQVFQLLEGFVPVSWAATAWLLIAGNPWWVLTAVLGLLLPLLARQRGIRLGQPYGEALPE